MNQQISQLHLAASPGQPKVTKGCGLGDQNGGFCYRDSTRFCSEFQKLFLGPQFNFRHPFDEWLHTPMVMINFLVILKSVWRCPYFFQVSDPESQHKRDQFQQLKSRKLYFHRAVPPFGVRDHRCVPYVVQVGQSSADAREWLWWSKWTSKIYF